MMWCCGDVVMWCGDVVVWWYGGIVVTLTGWELGRSDNIKTRARHLTGLTPSNPSCLY